MTDIATLRGLSREEADQHRPMRLRGVITYYEPAKYLAFLQDSTGGTYISSEWLIVDPPNFKDPIEPGLLVEVEGPTDAGRFAPFLGLPDQGHPLRVRILGHAPMPAPLRPVRGEILDPKFHSQWVEVEAFARDLRVEKERLTMTLVFDGRHFEAYIPGTWEGGDALPMVPGSDVRVRGVFGSVFNDQRQLIGVKLFVPSIDDVEVLDAGLELAFRQPARAVHEIMQFNPGAAERMRVRGTVIFQDPGRGFYLRDASGAVWAESDATTRLIPGTPVDVVGFAAIDHLTPVLRDAVFRANPPGPPPAPIPIEPDAASNPSLHGQLVRVEGEVVDRLQVSRNQTLALRNGTTLFQARFAGDEAHGELPPLGAWVAVTGICQNLPGAAAPSEASAVRPAAAFNLLLRSRVDLVILRRPPWWTVERLLYLVGGLAVVVAAALIWAALLRRRVDQQSAIIAEKVSQERIAEERTRIARELHDTLEQHLAGVAIQLDAAAARLPAEPTAAGEALTLGAAMLRHSRTEARRSVWDLRSQLLEQNGLALTLRDLVATLSNDTCQISLDVTGTERRLEPQIEFHLLRMAQEALTNSLKHGRPTRVDVTLAYTRSFVRLLVADNGIGFDPTANGARNGAHFGLLGIRERAAKIHGAVEIDSRQGQGARLTVTVPVA